MNNLFTANHGKQDDEALSGGSGAGAPGSRDESGISNQEKTLSADSPHTFVFDITASIGLTGYLNHAGTGPPALAPGLDPEWKPELDCRLKLDFSLGADVSRASPLSLEDIFFQLKNACAVIRMDDQLFPDGPGPEILLNPGSAFPEGRFDFTSRSELIFHGLDPPCPAELYPSDGLAIENTTASNPAIVFLDRGQRPAFTDSADAAERSVIINSPLTITATDTKPEIWIREDLTGMDQTSLTVMGTGHTTYLAADISMPGNIIYNDALIIQGTRIIESQRGNIVIQDPGTITGDGDGIADNLTLRAPNGTITILGAVGGNGLHDIVIDEAKSVIFQDAVSLTGSLTIGEQVEADLNGPVDVCDAASQLTIKSLLLVGADDDPILMADSGILDPAGFVALDHLGDKINGIRGELLTQYQNDEHGNLITIPGGFLSDILPDTQDCDTLPGTRTSLDRLLGIEQLLKVGQYIKHYLRPYLKDGADSTFVRDMLIPLGNEGKNYYALEGETEVPTIGGLLDYLNDNWIPTLPGGSGGLALSFGENKAIEIDFIASQSSTTTIGIDLGKEAQEFSLDPANPDAPKIGFVLGQGAREIDLDITADILATLSCDWSAGEVVSFRLDHFDFQASALVNDLLASAQLGPLDVSIGQEAGIRGVMELRLGGRIAYDNPDEIALPDTDIIRSDKLTFRPASDTPEERNNYLHIDFPLFAALCGVPVGGDAGTPKIGLGGSFFSRTEDGLKLQLAPDLQLTSEHLDQLLDFSKFDIGIMMNLFQGVLTWLKDVGVLNLQADGIDIADMAGKMPFIGKTLGDVLDFATIFNEQVVSRINFGKIRSIQDFVQEFASAGIIPKDAKVEYDPVEKTLRLPLGFTFDLNDFNLRDLNVLEKVDLQKLMGLGAVDSEASLGKTALLNALLNMPAVRPRDLIQWGLLGADDFQDTITICVSLMEDLGFIEEGALDGSGLVIDGMIALQDIVNSDQVAVRLIDLVDYGILPVALPDLRNELQSGLRIGYDALISSNLISADALNGMVKGQQQARYVDLSSLLDLKRFTRQAVRLSDLIQKNLLGCESFKDSIVIPVSLLESLGLIEEGALDGSGLVTDGNIALGDLLDSDQVAVQFIDLITYGLISRADLKDNLKIDYTKLIASKLISAETLSKYNIPVTAGYIDLTSLLNLTLCTLDTARLQDDPDNPDDNAIAAQDFDFAGFDLYDLIDLGWINQDAVTSFKLDLFALKNIPIDLGLDFGDIFELSTTAVASLEASVEGSFEWLIDFDAPTGLTLQINNARIAGHLKLDVQNLSATARIGFVGLIAGTDPVSGLQLSADVTAVLDEDGNLATANDRTFPLIGFNSEDGKPFDKLASGDLSLDYLRFDLAGSSEACLKGLAVDGGSKIPGLDKLDLSGKEITISIPDLTNWSTIEVVTESETQMARVRQLVDPRQAIAKLPDLKDVLKIKDLNFTTIIAAIRNGLASLDQALRNSRFYDVVIPVINRTPRDVLSIIGTMTARLDEAAKNPAKVIQEVEKVIEDALGIEDDSFCSFSLDGETLKIHLKWDALFSGSTAFALDLGSLKEVSGMSESELSGLEGFDSFTDATGRVALEAFAHAVLDLGIDFSNITGASLEGLDCFIYDYNDQGTPADATDDSGTRLQFGIRAEAHDLNLLFKPFDIGVKDGWVAFDRDGEVGKADDDDSVTLCLAIDQQDNSVPDDGKLRFSLEETDFILDNLDANLDLSLKGNFQVMLPFSLPDTFLKLG